MNNKIVKLWLGQLAGIHPMSFIKTLKGLPSFLHDLRVLKQQKRHSNGEFPFGSYYPMLQDKSTQSGSISGGYFYQDLYVAKKIFCANPQRHVDIGSRIDGFVAHIAVFREIEVFDVRRLESSVSNILFKQADLMKLPENMDNYCDSISALHSIEHFGLGRYGDPLDYYGHVKAIQNITTILKSGGTFYLSVPTGKQRIEFNAHRVFSHSYLWGLLKNDYELISFSCVDYNGVFHEDVPFIENESINHTSKVGVHELSIFTLRKK